MTIRGGNGNSVCCGTLFFAALLIAAIFSGTAEASGIFQNSGVTVGFEYLSPTDDDRNIKTINIDYSSLLTTFDKLNLSIMFDIVATYAEGDIIQLEGSLAKGTLREVRYENSALGIGPGLVANFNLARFNNLSVNLNGSGHFVMYNKRFPAGGDYYNFMWRGGPVVEYALGARNSISLGYQRSHVSNGQGLSPNNPSYDAHGLAISFSGHF